MLRKKHTYHQWRAGRIFREWTPLANNPQLKRQNINSAPEGLLSPPSAPYPHPRGYRSSNFHHSVPLFQILHSYSEEFKCSKIHTVKIKWFDLVLCWSSPEATVVNNSLWILAETSFVHVSIYLFAFESLSAEGLSSGYLLPLILALSRHAQVQRSACSWGQRAPRERWARPSTEAAALLCSLA